MGYNTGMKLNIPVVCGSVRPNSNSMRVSKFFAKKLQDAGHDSQIVEFVSLPLPLVNSEVSPSHLKKVYPDANVQKWSGIADAADGFVFIIPEYNHGYSGALKNALDWLYVEFKLKPAGLVGVSDGTVGGIRAIEQLRPIMGNFAMFDLKEAVAFESAQDVFDVEGNLLDQKYLKRIDGVVNSLVKVAEVMKQLRV